MEYQQSIEMPNQTAHHLATLLCQICSLEDKQEYNHIKAFGFDNLTKLVAEKWMSNPKRYHLDAAWLQLWKLEAQNSSLLANILDYCRTGEFAAFAAKTGLVYPASLCLDVSGSVHNLSEFCLNQIKAASQKGMRVTPGLVEKAIEALQTEEPRAWLNAQGAVKKQLPRILDRTLFFSIWSRSPSLDFAQGNYSDICTAFHAPKCDNSDIMFFYLFDPSIFCLEIYINFRCAGQIHCVVGRDELAGRRVLLIDSFDLNPYWRRTIEQLAPAALKALKQVAGWIGADGLWINTKVFTPSAARFAAVMLAKTGISYELHQSKNAPPRLKIASEEALAHQFCRSQPWKVAQNHLHQLDVRVGRPYLDAFEGFVESERNCQTVYIVEA